MTTAERGEIRQAAALATLRKDDDALRILRKHAPEVARKVEELDATFAALLEKLEKIEATPRSIRASPSRSVPAARAGSPTRCWRRWLA